MGQSMRELWYVFWQSVWDAVRLYFHPVVWLFTPPHTLESVVDELIRRLEGGSITLE